VTRQKAAALAGRVRVADRAAPRGFAHLFRVAWAGRVGHLGQDRKEGILLLQLALLRRIELIFLSTGNSIPELGLLD
jgi:hypothetical protein